MTEIPNVLIVEDTEPSAALLSELVKLVGASPRIAMTGAQALELAQQLPLQLIIMDMCLPDGDGTEWARRIRDKISPEIAIWACSGLDAADLMETAWDDMPYTAWIQKPFDVSAVTQKLSTALQTD